MPELQGRPVAGEPGDPFADQAGRVVGLASGRGGQGLVDLETDVDVFERDLTIAEGIGHVGIHLGDDHAAPRLRLLNCRRKDIHFNPE